MNNIIEKEWTILMYLNGNNELEPEIRKVISSFKDMKINNNINIVIEIGRESLELVKTIRTVESFSNPDEKWTGVRRYCFIENKIRLVRELGKKNMADPLCMYEFIKWGIENYPANHYMLILGGHSCSLVGAMPDYSQDAPYIMGFPEMSNAIIKASKDLNTKIDILVLDICYFNFIEVIYEFGKDKDYSAQNILTYIGEGPLYGLPYYNIVQILEKNIQCNDLDFLIRQFIDNLHFNLVAFRMDYCKLQKIKALFNALGEYYLNQSTKKEISLYKLFSNCDPKEPMSTVVSNLRKYIQDLVICSKRVSNNSFALINLITELPPGLYHALFYYRLSFTKGNKWCFVVNTKKVSAYDLSISLNSELYPIEMPTEIVYKLIEVMNPQLKEKDTQAILKKLLSYRN